MYDFIAVKGTRAPFVYLLMAITC